MRWLSAQALRLFFQLSIAAVPAVFAGVAAIAESPSGAEITEPAFTFSQPPALAQKCKKRHREEVEFDVLINSNGVPVQYYFRTAHGDEADLIALRTVAADRFSPAKRDGEAIQVQRTVSVNMDLCVEKHKESDGTRSEWLSLASTPDQRIRRSDGFTPGEIEILNSIADADRPLKVGGSISAPKALVFPEAHYTTEARNARMQGVCLLQLIVDQHGAPENVHVIRPLGLGLDAKAIDAAQHYRFRPAMKYGQTAVPVSITVEVNFRLY